MTDARKATTKKVAEHRPPADVRENTKARRAWLAAKAAELATKPDTTTKVLNLGSYQTLGEYLTTYTAGRIQYRGTCQVCGREQAIEPGGFLTLHGYTRPGTGWTHGRCDGTGRVPANTSVDYTGRLVLPSLEELAARHDATAADREATDLPAAKDARAAANRASTGLDYKTPEGKAAHVAWSRANTAVNEVEKQIRDDRWIATQTREFAVWLDATTKAAHGTPLTEVIMEVK